MEKCISLGERALGLLTRGWEGSTEKESVKMEEERTAS